MDKKFVMIGEQKPKGKIQKNEHYDLDEFLKLVVPKWMPCARRIIKKRILELIKKDNDNRKR